MRLEILFVAMYALNAASTLWSLTQLRSFLAETPEIVDRPCLERYKALVRIQMYLALGTIVLLTGGLILGIALIMRHGLLGLLVVLLVNLLVLGLGLYHRKVETRARTLRAGSEALASEYRRISETWVKKPLPDF